jgi:hemoglobin
VKEKDLKTDIQHRSDICLLVDTFYDKVLKDDLLSPHFAHINFENHMPRMVDFWCFTILDEGNFRGNIFDKHVSLAIDETHFTKWLFLFHQTMNELFEGEKATMALQRADLIGYTFASKMKALNK